VAPKGYRDFLFGHERRKVGDEEEEGVYEGDMVGHHHRSLSSRSRFSYGRGDDEDFGGSQVTWNRKPLPLIEMW